jgi:hypothetical protein
MKLILQFAILSCFAATLGLAGDVRGWLVDSRCFASIDGNRNAPEDQSDENLSIRYCSPRTKTRSFSIVEQETGSSVKFDSAGNEKAISLGLNASNKFAYLGKVTGVKSGKTFNVQAISIIKRVERNGKGAPGVGM